MALTEEQIEFLRRIDVKAYFEAFVTDLTVHPVIDIDVATRALEEKIIVELERAKNKDLMNGRSDQEPNQKGPHTG
jgi:hypothetical protein